MFLLGFIGLAIVMGLFGLILWRGMRIALRAPDLFGTYLAACVTYASLYGRPVSGNPYDYYGKIDKETVAFLQDVADKTVRKFYGLP